MQQARFTRPQLDWPLSLYPTLVVRLVLTVIAAEYASGLRYIARLFKVMAISEPRLTDLAGFSDDAD